MGRETSGGELMGTEYAGREPVGGELIGTEYAGREPVGGELMGTEYAGRELLSGRVMETEAVLFDMDGLMFDTERLAARFWRQAGEENGLDIGEDFLIHVRGSSSETASMWFHKCFGERHDYWRVRGRKTELLRAFLDTHPIPVKKGLYELLEYLKARGIRRAVATSTAERYTMQYLKAAGVDNYFDAFVCGDMVSRCKPDPEIFIMAAKKLGIAPGRCMVLEDSLNGILAAFAGGFIPVMVPDIMLPGDELTGKLAANCSDLLQVIELFEK